MTICKGRFPQGCVCVCVELSLRSWFKSWLLIEGLSSFGVWSCLIMVGLWQSKEWSVALSFSHRHTEPRYHICKGARRRWDFMRFRWICWDHTRVALCVTLCGWVVKDLSLQTVLSMPHAQDDKLSMQTLHALGRCIPCLYFTRKRDGCRKGRHQTVGPCCYRAQRSNDLYYTLLLLAVNLEEQNQRESCFVAGMIYHRCCRWWLQALPHLQQTGRSARRVHAVQECQLDCFGPYAGNWLGSPCCPGDFQDWSRSVSVSIGFDRIHWGSQWPAYSNSINIVWMKSLAMQLCHQEARSRRNRIKQEARKQNAAQERWRVLVHAIKFE